MLIILPQVLRERVLLYTVSTIMYLKSIVASILLLCLQAEILEGITKIKYLSWLFSTSVFLRKLNVGSIHFDLPSCIKAFMSQ